MHQEISLKVIEEIADQLDSGMNCYLNKIAGEIISVIPDEDMSYAFGEASDEEMEKINSSPDSYIFFERMSSRDSYDMMMDFAEEVPEKALRSNLIAALNSKKPFRSFKSTIDDSEDFRQKWFIYKRNRYVEYVRTQISESLAN